MTKKPQTLIGLLAVALAGSLGAQITYSSEDFEGGTPNYGVFNGVNSTADPNSWYILPGQTNATAMVGTDYTADAGSRNGIVPNGDPTDAAISGTNPGGQHAFIAASANRRLTSTFSMTLASDGATALNVSLDFMSYALEGFDALGGARIAYSALGDFTDEVSLYTFGVDGGPFQEALDQYVAEETWASVNQTFTEAGSGITFTDTAAIRIQRVVLVAAATDTNRDPGDTNTNQITFLDNIVVSATTAVPEASTFALIGLAGLALIRRRRA